MVTSRITRNVLSFGGKLGLGVFTREELEELKEAIKRAEERLPCCCAVSERLPCRAREPVG